MIYTAKFNNQELSAELSNDKILSSEIYSLAYNLLCKIGISVKRTEKTTVSVPIYQHICQDGQVKQVLRCSLDITPPIAPLTNEEFEVAMNQLLEDIPTCFHNFIRSYSYELGHSSGMDDVYTYACDLVYGLEEPIKQLLESST